MSLVTRRRWRFSVACVAAVALMGAATAQERSQSGLQLTAERPMVDQPVRAPHAVVASVNPLASEAGVEVLRKGGNAVDAAIAVATTLAVVHPEAGNLGGAGHMLIRMHDGRTASIDYAGVVPAAAKTDTPADELAVGYKAAAVPGTVAGLGLAHERFGRLSWRDDLERARLLAVRGFPASQRMALILPLQVPVMSRFPDSARIFLHGSTVPLHEGERVVQPELAATLKRLQAGGWQEFYTGETARLIAADMARHGGWITADDLRDYRAHIGPPLTGSYRGHPYLAVGPSASGGVQVALALNILERQAMPLGSEGSSLSRQLQTEALARSFAAVRTVARQRAADPIALLTSKAFAASISGDLVPGMHAPGRSAAGRVEESPDTTHFSIVDAEGNIVSNTYTLSGFYGSQVMPKGTGVMLNDLNRHYGARSFLAPGRRYVSAMSGMILMNPDGTPWAAIGSPGGATIPSTVMQVATNLIDYRMSLRDAVEYPRIHFDLASASIQAEPGALVTDVADRLRALGYTINSQLRSQGDVNAVMIEPGTGLRIGAADGRRGGAALGY